MNPQREAFTLLLGLAAPAFTQPSYAIFTELISAWVLCPARHTVTALIRIADPGGRRAHDAYHRFLRAGVWSMAALWASIAKHMVEVLCGNEEMLYLDVDDTLLHKSGRKVAGAANFRDPIRSRAGRLVYALGLNVVVLTLRIRPPWGGEPLGCPINVRLFHKGGPTHNELAAEMLEEVAAWLPEARFVLSGDGAYAALAAVGLPRTQVVSRMRRNAAVYEPAPPRVPGQRGRPQEGPTSALPLPARRPGDLGASLPRAAGQEGDPAAVCPPRALVPDVSDPPGAARDRARPRAPGGRRLLLHHRSFRQPGVGGGDLCRAVVHRGHLPQHQAVPRWRGPQCWKARGPERAAALSFWTYSAVWTWYLTVVGTNKSWPDLPWYPSKCTPSFADALACLRRTLWRSRIFATSEPPLLLAKIADTLIDVLARAA